jgi:hypothetical protein
LGGHKAGGDFSVVRYGTIPNSTLVLLDRVVLRLDPESSRPSGYAVSVAATSRVLLTSSKRVGAPDMPTA